MKLIISITISLNLFFLQHLNGLIPANLSFATEETFGVENEDLEIYSKNKVIPEPIREVALEALSYFPELMDSKIEFQFKNNIKGSVMQAQPKTVSLVINNKDNRSYRIKVSRYLKLEDEWIPIEELPKNVLLGWIGHELGHIKDYTDRSAVGMMHFGAKYFCSPKFITQAEVNADSYAVAAGMAHEIIALKQFILNHDRLPEEYKAKIRRLYMSPGEIMSMVDEEDILDMD